MVNMHTICIQKREFLTIGKNNGVCTMKRIAIASYFVFIFIVLINSCQADSSLEKLTCFLKSDGTYSLRSIAKNNCKELIIPSQYNGKPISDIYTGAIDCLNITSITIPDNIRLIHPSAFYNCEALEIVTLGKDVEEIFPTSFENAYHLQKIVVDEQNVTYHAASDCLVESKSKLLIIGGKSGEVPNSVVAIGEHAFYERDICDAVSIPKEVGRIGEGAFACSTLKSIVFSDGLRVIEKNAFYGTLIEKISIPDAVEFIDIGILNECHSLEYVFLGSGIKQISSLFLDGCNSVKKIEVSTSNPYFYSKDNCIISKTTGRLIGIYNASRIIPTDTVSIAEYGLECDHMIGDTIVLPDSLVSVESFGVYGYNNVNLAVYIPKSVTILYKCSFFFPNKSSNIKIFCEASEKPELWDEEWVRCTGNCQIFWGYNVD